MGLNYFALTINLLEFAKTNFFFDFCNNKVGVVLEQIY